MSDVAGPSVRSTHHRQDDETKDRRSRDDSPRSPQGFRIFGAAAKSNGGGSSWTGSKRSEEDDARSSKRKQEGRWSSSGWKAVGQRPSLLDRIAPSEGERGASVDRGEDRPARGKAVLAHEAAEMFPEPLELGAGLKENKRGDGRPKRESDGDEERFDRPRERPRDSERGSDKDTGRRRSWGRDAGREKIKEKGREREKEREKEREREREKKFVRDGTKSREEEASHERESLSRTSRGGEADRDWTKRRERSASRDSGSVGRRSERRSEHSSPPPRRHNEGRIREKSRHDDDVRMSKRRRRDNGWKKRERRNIAENLSDNEDDEYEREREERRRKRREAEEEREREERDRELRQRERQRRRDESRERRERDRDGKDEIGRSLAAQERGKIGEDEQPRHGTHEDQSKKRPDRSPKDRSWAERSPSRWRGAHDDSREEREGADRRADHGGWRERRQYDGRRESSGRQTERSKRSPSPGGWRRDRHRRGGDGDDVGKVDRRRRFRDRYPSPLPTPPIEDKAPVRLERKDKSKSRTTEQSNGATKPVEETITLEEASVANASIADDEKKDDNDLEVGPSRAQADEMYERISQVGEGTYGQVFKARGEKTGVVVALKKIRMESEKDGFPVTAMREIKLLQGLRHPNVVRLHEMMLSKNSIYMVFEYLEHDLNGILSQPTVVFEPCHLKSLASQLLSGLAYLHHRSILHRDLKGSNLLLNNAGVLKLADFGLARSYMKRKRGDYTNRVVTLWYRPPELLLGATQYGAAVDVWGAGCIFLELFTRKPVLQGQDEIDQVKVLFEMLGRYGQGGGDGVDEEWPEMKNLPWYDLVIGSTTTSVSPSKEGKLTTRRRRLESLFSKYAPPDALDVVDRLLHFDPAERASAAEALELPYFAANEPKAERPAKVLSAVEGEWHEYESRRARRQKTIQQREEQHQPQEDSMTLTDDKREASA